MARRRRPPRAGAINDLSPIKITGQILALQAVYYFAATVLILFTSLVAGKTFGLDLILSWRSLRGDTTVGWTLGLCWMLDALVGVILLLLLVERSKMVPDFALTIHFIHFLITSAYTRSLPTNALWWGLQICSAGLMISLGIWACQWRQLRPMAFGKAMGFGKAKTTPALPPEGFVPEEAGGSIMGFARRSRARDGGGSYEMVGLGEEDENV